MATPPIGQDIPAVTTGDANNVWSYERCHDAGAMRVPTHGIQRGHRETTYSINSVAAASSLRGIVRPRAFAVLRLMTRSNLVGWATGRLAGFSPLRTLPT